MFEDFSTMILKSLALEIHQLFWGISTVSRPSHAKQVLIQQSWQFHGIGHRS
jgi:hypothetical protein